MCLTALLIAYMGPAKDLTFICLFIKCFFSSVHHQDVKFSIRCSTCKIDCSAYWSPIMLLNGIQMCYCMRTIYEIYEKSHSTILLHACCRYLVEGPANICILTLIGKALKDWFVITWGFGKGWLCRDEYMLLSWSGWMFWESSKGHPPNLHVSRWVPQFSLCADEWNISLGKTKSGYLHTEPALLCSIWGGLLCWFHHWLLSQWSSITNIESMILNDQWWLIHTVWMHSCEEKCLSFPVILTWNYESVIWQYVSRFVIHALGLSVSSSLEVSALEMICRARSADLDWEFLMRMASDLWFLLSIGHWIQEYSCGYWNLDKSPSKCFSPPLLPPICYSLIHKANSMWLELGCLRTNVREIDKYMKTVALENTEKTRIWWVWWWL